MIVMPLLAVKTRFHLPQTAGADYLGVHQCNQLIPCPEAFAMFVCTQLLSVFFEDRAGQAFQDFRKSGISIHVAATWLLSRINGFYPLNSVAATSPITPPKLFRTAVREGGNLQPQGQAPSTGNAHRTGKANRTASGASPFVQAMHIVRPQGQAPSYRQAHRTASGASPFV